MNYILEVVAALLCAGFLIGFYQILRVDWPQVYFYVGEGFSRVVSTSVGSFLIYRILPPLVALTVLSGVLEATDGASGSRGSIAALLFYSGWTIWGNRRFFKSASRGVSGRNRAWVILSLVLALAGGVLGLLLGPLVQNYLPDVSVFGEAVVTAVFVAALILTYQQLQMAEADAGGRYRSLATRYSKQISDLSERSMREGIDPYVVSSIFLTEQVQRPAWFQTIENGAAKLGFRVTTGPFQNHRGVQRSWREELDDFFASSRAVAAAREVGATASSDACGLGYYEGETVLKLIFALHNDSEAFVSSALRMYTLVKGEPPSGSQKLETLEFGSVFVGDTYVDRDHPGHLETQFWLSPDAKTSYTLAVHDYLGNNVFEIQLEPDIEVFASYPVLFWKEVLGCRYISKGGQEEEGDLQLNYVSGFRVRFG